MSGKKTINLDYMGRNKEREVSAMEWTGKGRDGVKRDQHEEESQEKKDWEEGRGNEKRREEVERKYTKKTGGEKERKIKGMRKGKEYKWDEERKRKTRGRGNPENDHLKWWKPVARGSSEVLCREFDFFPPFLLPSPYSEGDKGLQGRR